MESSPSRVPRAPPDSPASAEPQAYCAPTQPQTATTTATGLMTELRAEAGLGRAAPHRLCDPGRPRQHPAGRTGRASKSLWVSPWPSSLPRPMPRDRHDRIPDNTIRVHKQKLEVRLGPPPSPSALPRSSPSSPLDPARPPNSARDSQIEKGKAAGTSSLRRTIRIAGRRGLASRLVCADAATRSGTQTLRTRLHIQPSTLSGLRGEEGP